MSEQNFEYNEIVRIGEDAARTLKSPAFQMAYNATVEEITAAMFAAEPGHTKTLEEQRRLGNALGKVVGRMHHFVRMAEAEIAQRQNQPAADEYAGFATHQQ